VLLDEIGRGTSTADGLSIARAVVEYLHNQPRVAAKTLFATHFHELTECEDYLPRVRNYHLAVRERGGQVDYLHRVERGRAEKSFGLHVAKMAGMPRPVLNRANQLLDEYADREPAPKKKGRKKAEMKGVDFDSLLEGLLGLDINEMSPVEALTKLFELQKQAKKL
jgi:DNA mismatch repair protein MutS